MDMICITDAAKALRYYEKVGILHANRYENIYVAIK